MRSRCHKFDKLSIYTDNIVSQRLPYFISGLSLGISITKEQLMDNQYDALVPYRLEYISLTFHKANNTKLK